MSGEAVALNAHIL